MTMRLRSPLRECDYSGYVIDSVPLLLSKLRVASRREAKPSLLPTRRSVSKSWGDAKGIAQPLLYERLRQRVIECHERHSLS
ncbi:MAG: hypothetical protein V7L29_10075 [Nostoc sp.]